MPRPIRVYIIDDHDEVRRALLARLRSARDIVVVGESAEADRGLRDVRALRPDVVLVEVKRSDGRGLDIVGQLVRGGGASVMVLTSYPSEWERWAAHRSGAACYLLKDIESPQLIAKIHQVAPAAR